MRRTVKRLRLQCLRRGCRAGRRARQQVDRIANNETVTAGKIPVIITQRLLHATTAVRDVDVNPPRRPSSTLITLTTRPPSTFNIGQLNARSLGNKAAAVCDCIIEHRLDVLCVVESWHNATDSPSLIAATPPGYCYVEKARPGRARKTLNRNHGGICTLSDRISRFVTSHFLCTVHLRLFSSPLITAASI